MSKHVFRDLWPAALMLGVAAGAPAAGAAEWTMDAGQSSVTMYATKQGNSFRGTFTEFTATIDFDEAKPETGKIVGRVKTDSFKTADPQDDVYVRGYLEVDEFPEARFESSRIEKTADGYVATGELTLKGIAKPMTLQFAFDSTPDGSAPAAAAALRGRMTINRFEFDVAPDVDVNQAGRDVIVQIELDLHR